MGGSRWARSSFVYLLILIILIVAGVSLIPRGGGTEKIDFLGGPETLLGRLSSTTELAQMERIEVDEPKVRLFYNDGRSFEGRVPEEIDLFEFLDREGIDFGAAGFPNTEIKGGGGLGNILGILFQFLPLIIIGAILIFMLRQAQGSNSQAMSFGKSKARVVTANRPNVTFNDVAGATEAKDELHEVVEFLKFPEKFASLGARIPRGVLLVARRQCVDSGVEHASVRLGRIERGAAGLEFFDGCAVQPSLAKLSAVGTPGLFQVLEESLQPGHSGRADSGDIGERDAELDVVGWWFGELRHGRSH